MSRRSGRTPRAHQHNNVEQFRPKHHRDHVTDEPHDEGELFVGGAMSLADECMDDRPPAWPEPPGAVLRRAREARGLSIDDISRRTKIGKPTLLAIEAGDVSRLPATIYTRGFVRSYAQEVGLAPEGTAEEYLATLTRQDAGPAFADGGDVPPVPAAARPEHRQGGLLDDAERRSRQFGRVMTAAAAIGLVLYLASYGARDDRPDAEFDTDFTSGGDAVHASRVPGGEAPGATDASSGVEAPLRVDLAANGPCWVSVEVDGNRVLERLLQAGDRHTLAIEHEAVMRIGEPGALSISINGEAGRPLGRAGQPVSVTITRENFHEFLRS